MIWLIFIRIALLLSAQLVFHLLQRWQLKSVLHERERLAFEMHDTLAQSFTGIAYQLQAASIEHRGPDKVAAQIQNALQMVHTTHRGPAERSPRSARSIETATSILHT